MPNAYTTRGGLILPEVGQNLNTWGDLLNNNQTPLIDKGLFGFEAITVTTDFSLTSTNGDATSTQLNKGIYLRGTPAADFTATFLSKEQIPLFVNATGKNATVKVTAGTGVTLANGDIALLGYNATLGDVTNVSPNRIAGAMTIGGAVQVGGKVTNLSPGTVGTDAVNLTQLSNALAAILTAGDGSFFVRATDTTRKFLDSAVSVDTTFITKAITNPAGNEILALSGTGKALNSATDTTGGYLNSKITVSGNLVKSTTNPGGNEVINIAVDEGQVALFADAMS